MVDAESLRAQSVRRLSALAGRLYVDVKAAERSRSSVLPELRLELVCLRARLEQAERGTP